MLQYFLDSHGAATSVSSWALIFFHSLNVFFHLNEFTYTTGQELIINYLCLCLEVLQKQHEYT